MLVNSWECRPTCVFEAFMATDEVVDVPFCRVCRRSCELKWKKHVFSKGHQRAAAEFLAQQVAGIERWRTAMQADTNSDRGGDYCAFCELELESRAIAVEHYASTSHRKQLNEFCKHHRCDPTQLLRRQLSISSTECHLFLAKLTKAAIAAPALPPTSCNPTVSAPSFTPQAEAFLTSAAIRLEQVQAHRLSSAPLASPLYTSSAGQPTHSWMGPHATAFAKIRTLTSADGILQNPIGRHEGRRVWGGGIVKVPKAEWISWGIDLLVQAEEQRAHGESTEQSEAQSMETGHRVTEMAYGQGLEQIRRADWGTDIANVHSAAVPPWMVQTEEEYKQCNRRADLAEATARIRGGNSYSQQAAPEVNDIFSKLNPTYDEKTWLPNFGGVWQDGPRSRTKQAFKRLSTAATSGVDAKSSRSIRVHTPTRVVPKEKSVAPPKSIATAWRDREVQVPRTASPPVLNAETEEVLSKLDAKKQQLLAQKERLRAKLATKKAR